MDLSLDSIIAFVLPWKFSPTVTLVCGLAIVVYVRGVYLLSRAGEHTGVLRMGAYLGGVVSIYALMQTRLDYWSLHAFFMHRTQHDVLHHAGPFLVALAAPAPALARGTPEPLRRRLFVPLWNLTALRKAYGFIQQPVIATALFLGLMGYWLMPNHHFNAMLSDTHYHAMNWTLLVEGLLFWWMMLEPSHRGLSGAPGFGMRILLQWVVIMVLIAMGFTIVYSDHTLYPVYSICGRLWPLSPMRDQAIGGMLTWMPTSIISALAGVILLSRWMRQNDAQVLKQIEDTPSA
jgi:putative membrane protein